MSLKLNFHSRTGLAIFVAFGLASSGCASVNQMLGIKEKPSPKLSLAWAKLKESEGNFTSARHGYEEVLSKDPRNVDATLGMARLNLKAKRLVEAEEGFEKALALKPQSTEVLSEIGNFYSDQQRWDKAIPLLQECQRLEPHEKNYQFNLAVALAKSGQVEESIPHFKEAVSEAAAHYNVGRILVESGKRTQAEEQFVIALAKDPNLTDAQYFLDEIRAAGSGKAQQLPVIADANERGRTAQQVSGTTPVQTAEVQNPFEEAPSSGFSRSEMIPTRTVKNTRAASKLAPNGRVNSTPSGRMPLVPHQGYEELPPPGEFSDAPFDQNSASSASSASTVIQASAEEPASSKGTSKLSGEETAPRRIVPHRLLTTPGKAELNEFEE